MATVTVKLAAIEAIDPDLAPELSAYLYRKEVKEAAATRSARALRASHASNAECRRRAWWGWKVNMTSDRCTFEAAIRLPPAPGRMAMTNECVPVSEFIAVLKTHALSAWDYLGGAASF